MSLWLVGILLGMESTDKWKFSDKDLKFSKSQAPRKNGEILIYSGACQLMKDAGLLLKNYTKTSSNCGGGSVLGGALPQAHTQTAGGASQI
jgi:hypothetical protein